MMLQNSYRWNDFQILDEIYTSPSGRILAARYKHGDRKKYALKERLSAELGRDKNVLNELQLLKRTNHPNVLTCFGHFWDTKKRTLFLVLEFADGGDLYSFIRKREEQKRFNSFTLVEMSLQISRALCHLHENGIIHRDIKTHNILLVARKPNSPEKKRNNPIVWNKDSNTQSSECPWILKLGDLGVSRSMSHNTMALHTFYGTPLYASPELCSNEPYNEKTDIWSLGVVFYELAMLNHPFDGGNLLALAESIKRGKYKPISADFPLSFRELVDQMLHPDAQERPCIADIVLKLQSCQETILKTGAITLPREQQQLSPRIKVLKPKEGERSVMNERDRRLEQRRKARQKKIIVVEDEQKEKCSTKVNAVEVPKIPERMIAQPKKQSDEIKSSAVKRLERLEQRRKERKSLPKATFIPEKKPPPPVVESPKKEQTNPNRKYNFIAGSWSST